MPYYYLLLVNVPSTDNTEEHPSSNTDDKTSPSPGHGEDINIILIDVIL